MFAPRDITVEQRLDRLERDFPRYLLAFNAKPPFNGSQFEHHRRTIEFLRGFASAADAVRDEGFAGSLAATLKAWDIGVERHSQFLVPPREFTEQLRHTSLAVAELEHLRIDGPSMDEERAARRIWLILRDLDIVRYKDRPVKRKVVSGTKALHHLLPDLVFPMDNEYTATFFEWRDFGVDSEPRFKHAFRRVAAIARAVAPQSYVGEGWNTSVSKVLDNAIVGFCLSEGLKSRSKERNKENAAIIRAIHKLAEEMGRGDLKGDGLIKWVQKELPGMDLPLQI
jgi:hypothetical protein